MRHVEYFHPARYNEYLAGKNLTPSESAQGSHNIEDLVQGQINVRTGGRLWVVNTTNKKIEKI
jgi:hypothetical protein